ncbi:SDR family NAD(P)-dependent oxidoreductase [Sphingomonas sp. BAUL-RG-20F-R05-02]|uniref:SDR family NAD(P)-dependent oxidoreductase n=1 Tax=Sphingomonas sp. BAUL-RG-20F-R05-02 TaxID=2914830 RepID=UPI001F55B821|nr:SDR family NAD(P)-dependent oxidoreductase [Sphingomonas sp. BAUL-RG-20F-R05-02]
MNRILITGASGGLGTALAREYAAPGRTLLLWGRDRDRLESVAATSRAAGAVVAIRSLDLTDVAAAIAAIEADDAAGTIDLAIFAAGLGDIRAPGAHVEDAGQVARLGIVNFVAPAALASAIAARMARRGRGQVVLVGSAAAFHALPFASGYAGSKAGLARFADALRIGARGHGVSVTLVSPGFIDTAAAHATPGPKPFSLSPAQAAARIAAAAAQGRAHVVMRWPFAGLRWFDRLLPRSLRDRLLRALTPPGH